jgi:hypothetical protein
MDVRVETEVRELIRLKFIYVNSDEEEKESTTNMDINASRIGRISTGKAIKPPSQAHLAAF